MTTRTPARHHRLAATVAGVSLALLVASVAVNAWAMDDVVRMLGFNGVGSTMLGLTYPPIGWLVATRRPGNVIGWLLLAIGASQASDSFASAWSYAAVIAHPGSLPFGLLAAWFGAWLWVPGFTLLFAIIAVFPDGHLPSRRWRWVPALAGLAIVLTAVPMMVVAAIHAGPEMLSEAGPDLSQDPLSQSLVAISNLGNLLTIPLALGALGALVQRYRTSDPVGRAQVRWLAAAGTLQTVTLIVLSTNPVGYPLDVLIAVIVMPLLPAALTIAILRYRLFEIDRIISRTVSWGLVTGLLVAVFATSTIGLEALLASFTGGGTLAVAASTLAAAALFQPVRRRVQALVDRRFNRAKLDAERTVATFSEQLRVEAGLTPVATELQATVARALEPVSTSLWLRGGAGSGSGR